MLFSLLPPSCIVAPIDNIVNKFISPSTFSTTIMSHNQQTFLPTVHAFNNIGMDKSTETNPVINHKTRGRSSHIKKNLLRDTSISFTYSSIIYRKRVIMNNSMDVNSDLLVESSALSYETE